MLILGLGTGRCGTKSVAQLLEDQAEICASHEYKDPYTDNHRVTYKGRGALLSWDGTDDISLLVEDHRRRNCAITADVSFYTLPYVEDFKEEFDEVKVFCIKRNREETIDSYDRWTEPRNHWNENEGQKDIWDRCFPNYNMTFPKKKAIGCYYDEYYRRAEKHCEYMLRTEDLNNRSKVKNFLKWIGVSNPIIEIKHANEHKRHGTYDNVLEGRSYWRRILEMDETISDYVKVENWNAPFEAKSLFRTESNKTETEHENVETKEEDTSVEDDD